MTNHAYEIHTERLIIRCYHPSDAQSLKEAIDSSLDHLLPWMPRAKNEPEDIAQKVARIRKYRGQFDLDKDYTYGVFEKDNKTLVGASGLHTTVGDGGLEVGYRIRSSHIGRGFATEVAQALTKTGFEIIGVDYIEIHCNVKNERSANVPRKLGFTQEAIVRVNKVNDQGERRQDVLWKMFKEDYAKSSFLVDLQWFDETGSRLVLTDES